MSTDFYSAITKIAQSHLLAHSINTDMAINIAKGIVTDVSDRFGGTAVYLKNNTQQRANEKHQLIISEFTGKNHDELIQRHHISKPWLIKILKKAGAHDEKAMQ